MKPIKQYRIFIFLMIVLTSCSNNGKDNVLDLEYWSSSNSGEITFSKNIVEQWNKQNPGKNVKFQPVPEGQSSEEIILAAIVGKTTPDIYSNMWQGSVEFYANSKVLIALDTIPGFTEFIFNRCDSITINEITSSDGHIYQVPWKINPIMTLYNKNVFSGLGFDTIPSTYTDFLKAAEKIKTDTDNDGYTDRWIGITSTKVIWYQRLFNFYPLYIAASDGLPLIKDNKAFFNNEYAIGVFRFLQEIYKQNYFSKDRMDAMQDQFIAKRVATKFTGPWEINYLEKFKPEDLEYDFSSMPVPDTHTGPIFTYCDPKSIVVFNTCENPRLAFEFIKTMVDEQGDLKFLEINSQLPRRKGLDTLSYFSEYFTEHPELRVFAKQAKYIKGVDNCEALNEVFDIISQEYEACVLYNIKSPEKAIADAEKAVNILLRVKK